jgi:hypothetical protein
MSDIQPSVPDVGGAGTENPPRVGIERDTAAVLLFWSFGQPQQVERPAEG